MANTRETMGEQACLDALVANTLTSFEDDGITKVGANCLRYHTALTDVTMSQCKSVESYGLADCTNLEVVDMQGTGTIDAGAFKDDAKLAHLVIRGTTKTTNYPDDSLVGTPIARNNGAVYVNESVLSDYESDLYWKRYRIATLSEYPLSTFDTIADDWATIISKAESGIALESYSIGDTKLLDLGEKGIVYAQIVAFNADALASDNTKTAGITFITKAILENKRMNPNNSGDAQGTGANGGWEYSEMRSYLTNTILPLIPSNVRSAIKEVIKYSDYIVPGESTITHDQATTDKLWIPSAREVRGTESYEQTGPIYDNIYGGYGLSRQKFTMPTGAISTWYTRTAKTKTEFVTINTSGNTASATSSTANGVVIGFCI